MITSFISDMKNKLRDESGSALLSVLLIFTVLLILLGSTSTLALSNYKKSIKSKHEHALYYLAEARMNEFQDLMFLELETLAEDIVEDYASWSNTKLSDTINSNVIASLHTEEEFMASKPIYDVKLIALDSDRDSYTISSTISLDEEKQHIEKSIHDLLKILRDK